jgi:hypothetical protein
LIQNLARNEKKVQLKKKKSTAAAAWLLFLWLIILAMLAFYGNAKMIAINATRYTHINKAPTTVMY